MLSANVLFFAISLSSNLSTSSINLLIGLKYFINVKHCVKIVRIWSFSGLYFPAFWLNAVHFQFNCGKTQTRKTPNTDTFYAVKRLFFTFRIMFFSVLIKLFLTLYTALTPITFSHVLRIQIAFISCSLPHGVTHSRIQVSATCLLLMSFPSSQTHKRFTSEW